MGSPLNTDTIRAGASNVTSTGTDVVSVGNSALYITDDNSTLTRTPVTAGNRDTWTFSTWVYRTLYNSEENIFTAGTDDNNRTTLKFNAHNIQYFHFDGGGVTDVVTTTAVYRDIGWYHIVLAVDTTKAVEDDRVIIYVNGERVTAFSAANYPAQNTDTDVNSTVVHTIGASPEGSNDLDGYLAETVLIDGLQLTPLSFGAYDSTGLYWTPLATATIQELTFGTNGFYLSNTTDLSSNMTTFVDSSSTGHTITTSGNTTHSGLRHKVQNSVIYVDGTTDYISVAPSGHADFTLGTGNFCIEGWFNRTVLSGTSNYSYLFDFRYSGNNLDRPACYMDGSNNIMYDLNNVKITSSTDPAIGAWFHLAIARYGSTTTMYLNGTSVGSFTDNTDYLVGRPWFFEYPQSNAYGFHGYATELRISKGASRYTANFTPSTTAFVSDSNTSLLVHSDKFFGVANDDSGKYNHRINSNTTKTTHTPTNLNAVLSPLQTWSAYSTISNGGRTAIGVTSYSGIPLTIPVTMGGSNKWYMEFLINAVDSVYPLIGVAPADFHFNVANAYAGSSSNSISYQSGGLKITGGSTSSYGASFAASDVIGMLITESTGTVQFWKQTSGSGSFADQGNIVTGYSGEYLIAVLPKTSAQLTVRIDSSEWGNSSPPSDAKALNTTNKASGTSRTLSDSSKYFQTVLYEGNGGQQRVGNFQPFTDSFTVSKGALFPATGYLSRTFDEAGNRQIFTLSTWFKIGLLGANEAGGVGITFFSTKNGSANSESTWFVVKLNTSNQLVVSIWNDLITTRTFKDTSQWNNLVVAVDTTQGTAANRIKVYINGVQLTDFGTTNYPSSSASLAWGVNSTAHYIGARDTSGDEWQGYLAQTAYITGTQLTPSSFGQTDTSSNRWVPKDISGLTYGSAGFFLDYADSSNVGDDESGNTNDFTNVNTVAQSGDTPTVNWNIIFNTAFSGGTLSNGNRSLITGSSEYGPALGSLGIDSGKWYWEVKPTASSTGTLYALIGISRGINLATGNNLGYQVGDYGYYSYDGDIVTNNNGAGESYGASYAVNDIIGVALDLDNKTVTFYKNNTSQGVIKGLLDGMYYTAIGDWNGSGTTTFEARFDSSLWSYSAPTDHIALAQDNIASSDQFITALSWIKNRDTTDYHMLENRVTGAGTALFPNDTAAASTQPDFIHRFLAGGVQIGEDPYYNTANESYVFWNFMMQATGSGTAYESGSINTTALVDGNLGISVGTYTGTGSANETIQTGLTGCEMIIVKRTNATYGWAVWHAGLTDDYSVLLNTAASQVSSGYWDTSGNTSTLIELGTDSEAVNKSSQPYVFIAFAPSQFISIGKYTNNNNADGTYVPTLSSLGVPLQPVFVLTKTLASANWFINDVARIGYNVDNNSLYPNTTGAEATADVMDIVTGGFKLRTALDPNYQTATTIYMAIGTPIIDTDGRIIAGR
jgi:hypothetical protein